MPEIAEPDEAPEIAEETDEPEVVAHSEDGEHAPCVFNNGPSL